jgi:2-amino-4-hydroxy-6-hydroxymethyldihydropteridine diphosphokinase
MCSRPSNDRPRVFLGLGGNLGDVLETFRCSLAQMTRVGIEVVEVSSAYKTVALSRRDDRIEQSDYWNAVCEVRTTLGPFDLLALLKKIERRAGRVKGPRWASRPLDIDLLAYGDTVLDGPRLTLPHPGILDRPFVLQPWAEIAPEQVIAPLGVTVAAALRAMANPGSGILAKKTRWSPLGHVRRSQ